MNKRLLPTRWVLAALCTLATITTTRAQSVQWVNRIGGTGTDRSQATAFDANGNVYITGAFSGTVDFDPGTGTANLTAAGTNAAFIAKYSSSGAYQWAIGIGGTGENAGYALCVDATGNVTVAGTFAGTTDFDPGTGVTNRTATSVASMFLVRYNTSGALQWVNTIGCSGTATALTQNAAGNLYVSGTFYGTGDFDPGSGTVNISSNDGTLYVAAYTSSGNYIWAKNMAPSSGSLSVNSLGLDANNNIYMSGEFNGSLDFDPGTATATMSSIGYQDIYLMKLDKNGNYKWSNHMGCPVNVNTGKAIVVDKSGNIYMTGNFYNTVDFDPGAGTANLVSTSHYNIYLAQYDSLGSYKWAKNIGYTATSSASQGQSLCMDEDGNVFVGGYFSTTTDFDPSAATAPLTALMLDGFIAKYDKQGNYLWAKSMKAAHSAVSPSYPPSAFLAIDRQGYLYSSGGFLDTTDFAWSGAPVNRVSAGALDIFVTRYSKASNVSVAETGIIPGSMNVYPNPASGTVNITYELKEIAPVTITIADITGKTIALTDDGIHQKGKQKLTIDASRYSLSPGVYFITLQANKEITTKRLLLTGR